MELAIFVFKNEKKSPETLHSFMEHFKTGINENELKCMYHLLFFQSRENFQVANCFEINFPAVAIVMIIKFLPQFT